MFQEPDSANDSRAFQPSTRSSPKGLPVIDPVQPDVGLGDGVLLNVQGQPRGPLNEALLASLGKPHAEGEQNALPERP